MTPVEQIEHLPLAFADLPGWPGDDHAAALRAFLGSCRVLAPRAPSWERIAQAALALTGEAPPSQARQFFEHHFEPHAIAWAGSPGMVTGYYEPVLQGSRVRNARFGVPLRRRPPDLVNLVDEADRAAAGDGLSHARRTPQGLVPFATRAQIEQGALSDASLEFLYLEDPVDKFFLQVQGSGLIRFQDGTEVRLAYDGKNGHPYTSLGRHLIETGQMAAERMTLQALAAWLRADPVRGRETMNRNQSYVFFRELDGIACAAPVGVRNVPLTTGRSLAVDPAFHDLGLPVFVIADGLRDGRSHDFRRLMIAQDVGSAIRGPERGDIYFGSGAAAGRRAGRTRHPARFVVLLPRVGTQERAP